jgi:hypothetical protein
MERSMVGVFAERCRMDLWGREARTLEATGDAIIHERAS